MEFGTIPGFKALEFKEKAQAEVQERLRGLSPEERARKINEDIEHGPFADWWKRVRAAKRDQLRRELEREQEAA